MSDSEILEAASHLIDAVPVLYPRVLVLVSGIDAALSVTAPAGDPDSIAAQADTYHRVSQMCDQVYDDAASVNTSSLPASWRGQAAESATQALDSLRTQADTVRQAFAAGATALAAWADHLRTAQSQDAHGRQQLQTARAQLVRPDAFNLDPSILAAIKEDAASGCHARWAAATLAGSAAADASAALGHWPKQARAQQVRASGVSALSAVALAYNDGYYSVLSPAANMLASKHLDAMSPGDRAAFEKLVANASSLTEAEYLWKAASAGYNVGQLQSFAAVIHPHGSDIGWLREHLDPGIVQQMTTPDTGNGPVPARAWLNFGKTFVDKTSPYSQLHTPGCAPASTVMARLAADPVLTLGVTTGQGPAAVGGAKPSDVDDVAVRDRAQHLFNQYYDVGRTADDPRFLGLIPDQGAEPPGIHADKGAIALDDQLLTPVTGSAYEYQPLNDAADRQAVLPKIEAAVQAGMPVPVGVRSSSGAQHQMVIEDYRHGELEIYNPWGYTQWVRAEQFTGGQLGEVTADPYGRPSEPLPEPFGVALPHR